MKIRVEWQTSDGDIDWAWQDTLEEAIDVLKKIVSPLKRLVVEDDTVDMRG